MITAATAKRNTISDDASLSKLSPSAILTSDFGTFTRRMIVVAEIASGGESGRGAEIGLTVCDLTGVGVQDVAAAALVLERATGGRRLER